jgi:hypothetical protein
MPNCWRVWASSLSLWLPAFGWIRASEGEAEAGLTLERNAQHKRSYKQAASVQSQKFFEEMSDENRRSFDSLRSLRMTDVY